METLVFSIEEFSTYDGPVLRATVFLKGCPLRCQWCHNPEGQSYQRQIMKAQSGCEKCGACIRAGEQIDGHLVLTERSVAACPNRLLRFCGEHYAPENLVEKLEKLIPILNGAGGGVTFSGGEPLSHPGFLLECLSMLRGKTHRALQTSGYCEPEVFKQVLDEVDYVLYDIKLVDPMLHKQYTGVSNKKILANFETLCKSGKEFVVRTPLIPTVTDTPENITAIAELLCQHGVKRIELLPYNRFAGGKYAAVDMEFNPTYDETVPSQTRTEIFERYDIDTRIM